MHRSVVPTLFCADQKGTVCGQRAVFGPVNDIRDHGYRLYLVRIQQKLAERNVHIVNNAHQVGVAPHGKLDVAVVHRVHRIGGRIETSCQFPDIHSRNDSRHTVPEISGDLGLQFRNINSKSTAGRLPVSKFLSPRIGDDRVLFLRDGRRQLDARHGRGKD